MLMKSGVVVWSAAVLACCLVGCFTPSNEMCASPEGCGDELEDNSDAELDGMDDDDGGQDSPDVFLDVPQDDDGGMVAPESNLGSVCDSDDVCDPGLSCLDFLGASGEGECEVLDSVCSKPCEDDADCEGLSQRSLCSTDCAGGRSCVRVAVEDLSLGASCEGDQECGAGLSCLPVEVSRDGACEEVGRACSVACDDDAQCEALDPSAGCLRNCSGDTSQCVLLGN